MTQVVMDLMTKVMGAADTPWISPMCHIPPTEAVPPMVHLEVVGVVTMNHLVVDPQMMEEVLTQGGETQTPQTTSTLYDKAIPCLLRIEPGYTHLAYRRLMNITGLKCIVDYFDYARNTYPYELNVLRG